jgi:PKD repeat protein
MKYLSDFEYVYHGGCDNYMTVDFEDISTTTLGSAITGRKWYYRQSGAPTWMQFPIIQNPILPIIPSGIYDIRIIASSATGCADTLDRTISLLSSTADMQVSGAVNGCFPSGETFFNATFNSEYDTPSSYNWQFGDGETGTGASVSHTYGTPGNYNVRLVIQTEDGCTYTVTRNNAVQLADQPVLQMSYFIKAIIV